MTDNTDQPISEEEKIIVQTEDGFQSPLVYDLSGENGEYTFFFDEDNMSKTFTIHHDGKQQNIVYFINDGFNKIIVDIDLPETDT